MINWFYGIRLDFDMTPNTFNFVQSFFKPADIKPKNWALGNRLITDEQKFQITFKIKKNVYRSIIAAFP